VGARDIDRPCAELNTSQFWATLSASSYLVTTQKPPYSSLRATGHSSRMRAIVCGIVAASSPDR